MTLENEFCQPMPAAAIKFAEALPFTTYTTGYAQEITLQSGRERDPKKYAPITGLLYSDRTPLPKGFLKPGEQILETPVETYHLDIPVAKQYTHCPYPVESLLPSHEKCLLPPPLFVGQFIRHDVYNPVGIRRGVREWVSLRIGEHLEWLLLSEWTLDKS